VFVFTKSQRIHRFEKPNVQVSLTAVGVEPGEIPDNNHVRFGSIACRNVARDAVAVASGIEVGIGFGDGKPVAHEWYGLEGISTIYLGTKVSSLSV
jgi:hypothetical protein